MSEHDRLTAQLDSAGGADVGEYFSHLFMAAAAALRTQAARIAELEKAVVCPGVMRCAKCKFVLTRVNLYVNTGNVGAGDNATEPCPNGCGPLWPMTYRQVCEDHDEAMERWLERAEKAEAEREDALARIAKVEKDAQVEAVFAGSQNKLAVVQQERIAKLKALVEQAYREGRGTPRPYVGKDFDDYAWERSASRAALEAKP